MLGENAIGLEGTNFFPFVNETTLIGGGVVNPGVGKYSEVLGLNHCTISGEIGVSKIFTCKPSLGGEKSTGKLPKFKILETPTDGIIGELEAVTGVFKKGLCKLLESPDTTVEVPSLEVFPFLIIFSRSSSGVSKGNCGVDLMCLPLEATTETMEFPEWSRQVQVAIFNVLSSNAPSEPVSFIVQS